MEDEPGNDMFGQDVGELPCTQCILVDGFRISAGSSRSRVKDRSALALPPLVLSSTFATALAFFSHAQLNRKGDILLHSRPSHERHCVVNLSSHPSELNN